MLIALSCPIYFRIEARWPVPLSLWLAGTRGGGGGGGPPRTSPRPPPPPTRGGGGLGAAYFLRWPPLDRWQRRLRRGPPRRLTGALHPPTAGAMARAVSFAGD